MVPNVLVMPPAQAGSIIISKGESSVRAYDAAGVLLAFYAATIGSEHDPLPLGEWKINGVAREPKFHYNARALLGREEISRQADARPGSEQSGRAGMDRPLQRSLRDSRYPGAGQGRPRRPRTAASG